MCVSMRELCIVRVFIKEQKKKNEEKGEEWVYALGWGQLYPPIPWIHFFNTNSKKFC